MRSDFSIVVICKNEEGSIGSTLKSIQQLSNDVVVYDSGSTDSTIDIIKKFPVQFFSGRWDGFGKTRQKINKLAKHDWVLVIDADEEVSERLQKEILALNLNDDKVAYKIQLINHLGNKKISWGAWGNDFRIRFFNKKHVQWSDAKVHETIQIPDSVKVTALQGTIHHHTAKNKAELYNKMKRYAILTAEQYYNNGRKSTWIKRRIGPIFTFIKNYILQLGFLDGSRGYVIAKIIANYTFLKYKHLYSLTKKQNV